MNLISNFKEKLYSYFRSIASEQYEQNVFDTFAMEMTRYALNSLEKGISDDCYFGKRKLIVSLTTFDKRINDVYLTIESLMHQTVKANKIILWLSSDFESRELPETLKRQQLRGLQICFCKDILSYKKLIPALQMFPEDFVITVDDDVIYSYDMIENLIKTYHSNNKCVIGNRVKLMEFNNLGDLCEYNSWKIIDKPVQQAFNYFPTGVGGILYPPLSLNEEVFNENVFMDICKYGDDIWFKCMALLNDTMSLAAEAHKPVYYENYKVQSSALYNNNVFKNRNDLQLKSVLDKYDLYKRIKKEL
jgi:hypothetical protein